MANNHQVDAVVMGAGLVGLSAAICLAEQGKQVALIDAKKHTARQTKAWDTRVYAITPAVQDWLTGLGVLLNLERVTDVTAMQIWSEESELPVNLSAEDANLHKVASIIENKNLMVGLWKKVKSLNIKVFNEQACHAIEYLENKINLYLIGDVNVSADILIAADGGNSYVRKALNIATNQKLFNQKAVVANFIAEKSHGNVARQWFAKHNTLAFLPMPENIVSMVWSVSTDMAEKLLGLSGPALSEAVEEMSGQALGSIKPVSETLAFELKQMTASQLIAERVIFVGDAAHQIHPMAGQGVNLGFRDVMDLQSLIFDANAVQDIGEKTFLRKYERARKADILAMNTLTSGLDFWFANDKLLSKKLTAWGMRKIESQSKLKEFLINQAVA